MPIHKYDLVLILQRDEVEQAPVGYMVRENGGHLHDLVDWPNQIIVVIGHCVIQEITQAMAYKHDINDYYRRRLDGSVHLICYRITFPDGQRLTYCQPPDAFGAFAWTISNAFYDDKD